MASPTTNKGYTYPAHGGSVNTWDTPINADFDQIDLNFGGTYNITATSTTVATTFNTSNCTASSTATTITFPTSIAQNMYYNVTGSFNSSCTLTFPAVGSFYVVNNQLSGGTLNAKPSGGTAISGLTGINLIVSDGGTMWNTDPAAPAAFPSGTGLLFAQAAPPSGWTQDGSLNDVMIRITNGGGAGTGGSWTISGVTVSNYTLLTGDIPSHNHSYTATNNNNANRGPGSQSVNQGTGSQNTGNTGGGGPHTHGLVADGTWRPSYYNVIRATKN